MFTFGKRTISDLSTMNTSCSSSIDLRNSSDLFKYIYQPHELIFHRFVTPCIILIGFVGNASFIWTVVRVSSLHTSTFILLCSLAFTDLFTLIGGGINEYNIWISPIHYEDLPMVYNVGNIMTWFGLFASEGLVSLVSLERYLAICHPIKHHLIKGRKRTIRLSLIIAALSLAFTGIIMTNAWLTHSVLCFIWPLNDQYQDYPQQISTLLPILKWPPLLNIVANFIFLLGNLIIFIFNYYLYWTIILTLRRRKHNKNLKISANFERNIQQMTTMVIINGTVYFLYSTIFQANTVFSTMASFGLFHFDTFVRFGFIRDTAILLNASSNPVIYFITNSSYRRAFRASFLTFLGTSRRECGKEVTPNIL